MLLVKSRTVVLSFCIFLIPLGAARAQDKTFKIGEHKVRALAISPDSAIIAIKEYVPVAGERVTIFDIKRELLIRSFMVGQPVSAGLVFSKDSKLIMTAKGRLVDGRPYSDVKLWSVESGEVTKTLSLLGTPMYLSDRILVSHIGKSQPSVAVVHDVKTGEQLKLEGHGRGFIGASASPDGKYVATAERDHGVTVWEFLSGKKLLDVDTNVRGSRALYFAATAPVFGTAYKGASFYELPSGKLLERSRNTSLQLSNDGKMSFVVGKFILGFDENTVDTSAAKEYGDALHILSREKGIPVVSFPYQQGWLDHIEFSPDNRLLIAAGERGIVRIWDLSKLKL